MKPTIAALFGVIAMVCANNYPPSVTDDVVMKFKEGSQVKADVELRIQQISKDLPFVRLDDEDISFRDEDLDGINIFMLDAKLVVDGVRQVPISRVSTSKKNPKILIVTDTDGMLVAATKTDKLTGKSTEVTLISKLNGDNAYVTFTTDDLNDEELEKFRMEDAIPPGETRRLRGPQVHDFVDTSEYLAIDDDHRSLEESCESFDVIEVGIVVDSSLCILYGNISSNVDTLSQSIIAEASKFYEVPGLCKKLRISDMEIHCDPETDPIRDFLIAAGDGNGNICEKSQNGLLRNFGNYANRRGSTITGDAIHLFHGNTFTGTTTIGCAYDGRPDNGGICSLFNTGVNEISFSSNLIQQSKLVAHETGHICSAEHVNAINDVMFESLCGSCTSAFGSTSKNSINNKVDSTSCTSNEPVLPPSSTPSASPSTEPSAAPVPPPTPAGGGVQGDPHFKTWRGHHFDFHGECDLVLLHSSEFGSGIGLDVHIRTKLRRDMSYISSATLRIGTDILEVESQGVYYLNGVVDAELPDEFSGFEVFHTQPTDKQHVFEVHLGAEERINVKTYKDFVSIMILKGQGKHFGDSVGLMGDFGKGRMLARDGITVLDDVNAFGQEWQVLESEAILFRRLRLPQHPMECTLPPSMQASQIRRRLLESSVDELAAEKACVHWGEGKDDCVFDVLMTGDLEMAMVSAY
jgi:hypothetical protein